MKQQFRKEALILAVMLAVTAADGLCLPQKPLQDGQAETPAKNRVSAAVTDALSDFAETVAAQTAAAQSTTDRAFDTLTFSAETQSFFCGNEPVGNSFCGYCIQDGRIMVEAGLTETAAEKAMHPETEAARYVTLEEAAEKIGCELITENGAVTLHTPFQSARLVVKKAGAVDQTGVISAAEGYRDLHVLQYQTPADAYAAYQSFQQDGDVVFAEPDQPVHAAALAPAEPAVIEVPVEEPQEYTLDRWGIEAVAADEYRAWLKEQKSELPEITVAVIDSGVYAEHDWFKGRLADDSASFIKNENGGSFDDLEHGTACAGIITTATCENVKILPLKVFDSSGSCFGTEVYCAMMYALEKKVDAINMSLGGFGDDGLLRDAAAALAEADIPCCVSAGNEGENTQYFHPAALDSVITVSAIGRHNPEAGTHILEKDIFFADFSNYGTSVDFSAPGVAVECATVNRGTDGTAFYNGTSMAAPYVTACIANLLSYNPELTVNELYDALKADAIDFGEEGFDNCFGWGAVNLWHEYKEQSIGTEAQGSGRMISLTDAQTGESVSGGTFSKDFSVLINTSREKAELWYCITKKYVRSIASAETLPEGSVKYDGKPLPIGKSCYLNIYAVENGKITARYSPYFDIRVKAPQITDSEQGSGWGTKYDVLETTIINSSDNPDAKLIYTMDGTDPDPATAAVYDGKPILIEKSCVIKAAAVIGETVSSITTGYFTLFCNAPHINAASVNQFDENNEWCGREWTVTIDPPSRNSSAKIYYTTDGTDPSIENGILYTEGEELKFTKSTDFRCIAVFGQTYSAIMSSALHCNSQYRNYEDSAEFRIEDGVLLSYRGLNMELFPSDFPEDRPFTAVGARAFAGNPYLSSVTLPDTVTELGEEAFANMKQLYTVTAQGVTTLGKGVFKNDSVLTEFTSGALSEIPDYAFCECDELNPWTADSETGLHFSDSVKIGDYAFASHDANGNSLFLVDFSRVTSIGDYAFADLDSLYSTNMPAPEDLELPKLTHLGKYAFRQRHKLHSIKLSAAVSEIPEGTFLNDSFLASVDAPGVTKIGSQAFKCSLSSSQHSFIPMEINMDFSKITELGDEAFCGIRFSGGLTFSSLETLPKNAFCIGADYLSLPKVKNIPENAFSSNFYIGALYFENAETIDDNAIEPSYYSYDRDLQNFKVSRTYHLSAVVLGDQYQVPESGSNISDSYLKFVAYPNQSEYQKPAWDTLYATIDDSYYDYQLHSKRVNEYRSFTLSAFPVCFCTDVSWYPAAVQADGSCKKLSDKPAASGLRWTTCAGAGTHTYIAEATTKDGRILTSNPLTVTVTASEAQPEDITPEENTVLDFSDCKEYLPAEYASDGNTAVKTLRFKPTESGDYYFYLFSNEISDSSGNSAFLFGEDGTVAKLNALSAFHVNAGTEYHIRLSVSYFPFSGSEITVCLSQKRKTHLSFSGHSLSISQYQFDYEGKPIKPEAKINELTEGKDYILDYINCDGPTLSSYSNYNAYAVAYGCGDYYGIVSTSYGIKGVPEAEAVKAEESYDIEIPAIRTFTPEEDGVYTLCCTSPISLYENNRIAVSGIDSTLFTEDENSSFPKSVNKYNGSSFHSGSSSKDNASSYYCQYELIGGKTYYLSLQYGCAVPQPCTVRITRADKSLTAGTIKLAENSSLIFSDKPVTPKVIVSFKDSISGETLTLTEGTDYTLTYLHNDAPGTMRIVASGIGAYFNRCTTTLDLKPSAAYLDKHSTDLKQEQTETLRKTDALNRYHFKPEQDGEYAICIRRETESSDSFNAYITLCDEELNSIGNNHYYNDSNNDTVSRCFDFSAQHDYYFYISSDAVNEAPEHYSICVTKPDTISYLIPEQPPKELTEISDLDFGPDFTQESIGHWYMLNVTDPVSVSLTSEQDSLFTLALYLKSTVDYGGGYTEEYWNCSFFSNRKNGNDEMPQWYGTFGFPNSDYAKLPALYDCKGNSVDYAYDKLLLNTGTYYMLLKQDDNAKHSYHWDVSAQFVNTETLCVAAEDAEYTGKPVTPAVTVTRQDPLTGRSITLTEGTDYEIRIPNDLISAGPHFVYVVNLHCLHSKYVPSLEETAVKAYFNILPPKTQNNPLTLTEGTTTVQIPEAGGTVFYQWTPAASQYCFALCDLMQESVTVYDTDGTAVGNVCGSDRQFTEVTVEPGKTYTVAACFTDPNRTGSFDLRLLSDYRLFAECRVETEAEIVFNDGAALPEYHVFDGDTELQEGRDYELRSHDSEHRWGRGCLSFRGLGKYIGIIENVMYRIRPDDLSKLEADPLPEKWQHTARQLTLNNPLEQMSGIYGSYALFTFSLPDDAPEGIYYIRMPDASIGMSGYVFDGSNNYLAEATATRQIRMKAGDQLKIFCARDFHQVDETTELHEDPYTVAVLSEKPAETTVTTIITTTGTTTTTTSATTTTTAIITTVSSADTTVQTTATAPAPQTTTTSAQTTTTTAEPAAAADGDLNGDGSVTVADAVLLARFTGEDSTLTEKEISLILKANPDRNGDGFITILDVLTMLKSFNTQA